MSLDTWLVFADGSCEGEDTKEGGIGAVLISPQGAPVSFFSERVPETFMSIFSESSNRPIFELELLPIWCAILF